MKCLWLFLSLSLWPIVLFAHEQNTLADQIAKKALTENNEYLGTFEACISLQKDENAHQTCLLNEWRKAAYNGNGVAQLSLITALESIDSREAQMWQEIALKNPLIPQSKKKRLLLERG